MRDRPRFALPKPAPAGLWRRTPPMIFAPVAALLALALAWRFGAMRFGLSPALPGFAGGASMALLGFAVLAYLVKCLRRPAVIAEECETLPGRVGLGAMVLAFLLGAGVLAAIAPALGRVMLVAGLGALVWLSAPFLRQIRTEGTWPGPDIQFGPGALLVAAAVAPMLGWDDAGRLLIYSGAVLSILFAAISLRQLRNRRVPPVLLPLLALHLIPVAAYGAAAVQLSAGLQQTAYGLTLAGLIVLPVLALRAGTGLFLVAITLPLALSSLFFALLAADMPENRFLALLAATGLVGATMVCVPLAVWTMRDWARGRLATRSNAAVA